MKRICETHSVWSDFVLIEKPDLSQWERVIVALDAWRRPQLWQIMLWVYDGIFQTDFGMRWQKIYGKYRSIKWADVLSDVEQDKIMTKVQKMKFELLQEYLD